MKLSEAIRKGSEGRKQYKEWYWGPHGSVCALGAAMVAVGLDVGQARSYELEAYIDGGNYMFADVIDKNDNGWTFDQIVDWLEERGY